MDQSIQIDILLNKIDADFNILENSNNQQRSDKLGTRIAALGAMVINPQDSLSEICRDYEARYQKLPPKELILGTKNQNDNLSKFTETCSGTTVAFLSRVLNEGHSIVDQGFIDRVLDEGYRAYSDALELKQTQTQVAGMSSEDFHSTQLHVMEVRGSFDNTFTFAKTPSSEKITDQNALHETLQNAIEAALIPQAKESGRIGTTLSFNGKTYALSIEVKEDEIHYLFFDSHGVSSSRGKAYIFSTTDQKTLLEFIGKHVEYIETKIDPSIADLPPEMLKEIMAPKDGENELGFYVLGPRQTDDVQNPQESSYNCIIS